jgi:hypothetical protein
MTNPFGNLTTSGLEESKDVLGGGSYLKDSGVYDGIIKLAFAGKSDSGARSLTVHIDIDGKEYRETLYVTSREGKHYYHPKGDTSKKSPLPGFTTANDLALLSTGLSLGDQTIEEKVVKLYDFDTKAEVPTKVEMLTEMIGKPIKLGIVRSVVDKNVKDASGNYVPSGETKEENTIDKVFHAETGKTVAEFTAKIETAEFLGKWDEKNTGVTRQKAKGAGGKVGIPGVAPVAGGAKAPTKSLFG